MKTMYGSFYFRHVPRIWFLEFFVAINPACNKNQYLALEDPKFINNWDPE